MKNNARIQGGKSGPGFRTPSSWRSRQAMKITATRIRRPISQRTSSSHLRSNAK